jgi:hypothetical protein
LEALQIMDKMLNNVLGALKETPKKKRKTLEDALSITTAKGTVDTEKPVTTSPDGKENVKPWLWKPDQSNTRQEQQAIQ